MSRNGRVARARSTISAHEVHAEGLEPAERARARVRVRVRVRVRRSNAGAGADTQRARALGHAGRCARPVSGRRRVVPAHPTSSAHSVRAAQHAVVALHRTDAGVGRACEGARGAALAQGAEDVGSRGHTRRLLLTRCTTRARARARARARQHGNRGTAGMPRRAIVSRNGRVERAHPTIAAHESARRPAQDRQDARATAIVSRNGRVRRALPTVAAHEVHADRRGTTDADGPGPPGPPGHAPRVSGPRRAGRSCAP